MLKLLGSYLQNYNMFPHEAVTVVYAKFRRFPNCSSQQKKSLKQILCYSKRWEKFILECQKNCLEYIYMASK